MKKQKLSFKRVPLLTGWLVICIIMSILSPQVFADEGISPSVPQQQSGVTFKGRIVDEAGEPLPGAVISVVGSTRGAAADENGYFELNNVTAGTKLIVAFLGMQDKLLTFDGKNNITITMQEKTSELDEVTVVAFGKQKKESVISSITTVNTKDLKVPSSNLTTAFAGRIAGLISYQTSGEPGRDDADFFIRGVTSFGTGKVDPLILIDNVEVSRSDLSRMQPDDIASFSILKDATATALYGARGANGVILITTKEGREGKAKVSFRFENSFSSPTSTIEMADPITYMRLFNEAIVTRTPKEAPRYTESYIDNTIRETNPYVYPTVDWMNMLTKDVAVNQRANISISGGGSVARYYIAASFAQDNGILKVDKRNNFNSNINLKKYFIQSNININLTNTTEAILRVRGSFDDYVGPIPGGSSLYQAILNVSPVDFPAYYAPDEKFSRTQHILFGGRADANFLNPYAEMVRGYREDSKSMMMAQFELKQNLNMLIEGLSARLLGNTTRNSSFDLTRAYSPFYYSVLQYDRHTDTYMLQELNPENQEGLRYSPGYKTINSTFYAEGSLLWSREFDRHAISGMFVGICRNYLDGNAGSLIASLPQRNLGLSGRFTYAFDSRYFAEFNFGYNGSEKFDKGHRWGFFPSAGMGWAVSNEKFWQGNIKNIISKLKIRGTYGLVGNDEIGTTRFFYLSNVTLDGAGAFQTGYEFNGINRAGVSINQYDNSDIGWEIAYKTNLGIELGLLKDKLEIQTDIFKERRVNIVQDRADIPVESGVWAVQKANLGEANGSGIDISIDYKHFFKHDFWAIGRGNFTYARSKYLVYEEPDYESLGAPWRLHTGASVRQNWGYIAERLFIDEADIAAAPLQESDRPVMPGDIKYKDLNKDNKIDELDMAPIGRPTVPEINYGFGLSVGYKDFDASFFFSGSARSSFWISPGDMSPFRQKTWEGYTVITGLSKFIADDHWSEESMNPRARWPRLSTYNITNNNRTSTWWMYNGDFLRLKSAEVGYSLPTQLAKRMHLESMRIYFSGTNLLLFSNFKHWDIELGNNGLNYPLQKVLNVGLNIEF